MYRLNYTGVMCKRESELECVAGVRDRLDTNEIAGDQCFTSCPVECKLFVYEGKQSMASYPSLGYYALLVSKSGLSKKYGTSVTYDSFKQSTLKIAVFLESLNYAVIEESPATTLDELIGMIGNLISA
jgi:cyanate permease